MLPEQDTSSPYDISYRAMKMFIQQTVRGARNLGPHSLNFGSAPGFTFAIHYIDTSGTAEQAMAVGGLIACYACSI
jgi:hypothetical protein